jgi:hypothetical protein
MSGASMRPEKRLPDGTRLSYNVQGLGERARVISERDCRGALGARYWPNSRASRRRGDPFGKRRWPMQQWAAFCIKHFAARPRFEYDLAFKIARCKTSIKLAQVN